MFFISELLGSFLVWRSAWRVRAPPIPGDPERDDDILKEKLNPVEVITGMCDIKARAEILPAWERRSASPLWGRGAGVRGSKPRGSNPFPTLVVSAVVLKIRGAGEKPTVRKGADRGYTLRYD
jgi:hypothetical protein